MFLKEGAVEETHPFVPGGNIVVHQWSGITVVDDLDEMELRDLNGTFDDTLLDPGP